MSSGLHTLSAQVADAGGGNPSPGLNPISGRLTLDEGWAPYAQATVVLPLPTPDILALLDPRRQQVKMYLDASALFGSNPSSMHWIAYLRSRTIDRAAQTCTITVASGEAVLQDYKQTSAIPVDPGTTSLRVLVAYILATVIPYTTLGGTADAVIDQPTAFWNPGVSAWAYVQTFVQKAGLRLWCDEYGIWSLDVSTPNDLVGNLVLSTTDSITGLEDAINRDGDEWYDSVIVVYSWTDAAGVQQIQADTATVPGYSKALTIDVSAPYPGPGAASAVLSRAIGKGNIVTPRAVSDYDARPGMDVSVTDQESNTLAGAVSSIEWAFPGHEMDVKIRNILEITPYSWRALATGITWSASPAGGTWANE